MKQTAVNEVTRTTYMAMSRLSRVAGTVTSQYRQRTPHSNTVSNAKLSGHIMATCRDSSRLRPPLEPSTLLPRLRSELG